uniref:Uncharacterized protein n=1 Tax=Oryza sativa subsp. japonica TaxID=39947 RepID=Q6H7A6_ORYSJ|nr:hypothetical protein [Oryza sativa Japonica Group]
MELGCLVRANIAANDDAHACALQQEDDDDSGGRAAERQGGHGVSAAVYASR